jgi:hypothetical protein
MAGRAREECEDYRAIVAEDGMPFDTQNVAVDAFMEHGRLRRRVDGKTGARLVYPKSGKAQVRERRLEYIRRKLCP